MGSSLSVSNMFSRALRNNHDANERTEYHYAPEPPKQLRRAQLNRYQGFDKMRISTRFGFAFLCTPKCASTSIEAAINDYCNISFLGHNKLKHINARTYTEKVIPLHKHLFPSLNVESFCLIREPLEWIQSWYRYRSRAALQNPNHRNHRNYTGNISYDEFVESYIADGTRPPFASIRTQYDFIRLDNGDIGVDHIMPLDRMDLVADFILEKTGSRIKLPHKNVSPHKKSELTLDKGLVEKLRKHLRNDIALYSLVKKHGTFNRVLHGKEFSVT